MKMPQHDELLTCLNVCISDFYQSRITRNVHTYPFHHSNIQCDYEYMATSAQMCTYVVHTRQAYTTDRCTHPVLTSLALSPTVTTWTAYNCRVQLKIRSILLSFFPTFRPFTLPIISKSGIYVVSFITIVTQGSI